MKKRNPFGFVACQFDPLIMRIQTRANLKISSFSPCYCLFLVQDIPAYLIDITRGDLLYSSSGDGFFTSPITLGSELSKRI
jgi:hypothetical protein